MNKLVRKIVRFAAANLVVKEKHHNIVIEKFRQQQCFKCDKFDRENIQCTACKCLLDVKWKSLVNKKITTGELQITHCILGRWNDSEIADYYALKN